MSPATPGGRSEQELARVRVELARAAARATPLADLGLTTRDLSRVQPLLEQVLQAVLQVLGAEQGVLWVTDPVEGDLYPTCWVGLPDEPMRATRLPVGDAVVGRCVAERAVVLEPDVRAVSDPSRLIRQAVQAGIVTVLAVPLLTLTGEPVGALTAYFPAPADPDEAARSLVEVYARQAAEIVERGRLYAEAHQLAALQRRRNEQLRGLADAALALSAADTVDDLLRIVTEAAREVVGVHQGVTSRLRHGWVEAVTYVSLSEQYAQWRDYGVVPKGLGVLEYVVRENRPLRLDHDQLRAHPEWRGLADAPGHPPLPDYLAAPLIGRNGANLGLIQLSDRYDGQPFSHEDEAIVVQLAQMASSAIETLESLERAEATATRQRLLADAAAGFAELLDPDAVARSLATSTVGPLADMALVHLVEDDQVRLAAIACADPLLQPAAAEFFGRFPVSLDHPYGAGYVIATGEPQVLPRITDEMLRAVARDEAEADRIRQLVYDSGVIVPLTAQGERIGSLAMSRAAPYTTEDVDFARDLGSRAAQALANSRRYAFERSLADTLQRSLLPRSIPAAAQLTTASRYLPGAQGTQIGGDWYDVVPVDDGRLLVVVGDVMGHGVHAAAVMGQLRSALRAYALEGHGPAELLGRLDRVVQALDELTFTTCVVGLLDPQERTLCVASAGHLPPLLISPDGEALFVELDGGLPLGVGGGRFAEEQVDLAAGSTLLLYTDGLVEGRSTPVDVGMERLREACRGPVQSAEELCDRAIASMSREREDDTALLALLLHEAETGPGPLRREFPAVPDSAGAARLALREWLGSQPDPAALDVAELLVTELVSNAARHAGGELVLQATLRQRLLSVEVCDSSERAPRRLPDNRLDAEGGRGVLLVDQLSDRWGHDPLPTGKRVWFELSLDGG